MEAFPDEQFRIDNITVTDSKGNPVYPIDPRVPNVLYLYTYNYGPQVCATVIPREMRELVQIDDNKNNVKLYQYTRGWGSGPCDWSEMKTYGLLNNSDGCDFAHNCPLTHGDLVLILPLDLSQFAVIINAIAAYKPYQLEIRIFDYNAGSSHEEIACVMVQLEMS